jgi:hypothetical protein
MQFSELLKWITGPDGGAFLILSWALSWGLEGFSFWQKLTSKARSLIILGAAILFGLAGVWLSTRPDIVELIEPYVQVVIYIIVAWLATQTAHRLNPLRDKAEG